MPADEKNPELLGQVVEYALSIKKNNKGKSHWFALKGTICTEVIICGYGNETLFVEVTADLT